MANTSMRTKVENIRYVKTLMTEGVLVLCYYSPLDRPYFPYTRTDRKTKE